MKRIPTRCLVAAILTSAGASVALAADATTAPAPGASQASPAQNESPYLVVEDKWIYVIDGPGVFLDRARDDLGHMQPKRAAANVRKAAR